MTTRPHARFTKIGIVGGTAWASTAQYYSLICRRSEERFGSTPEFSIESLELRHAVSLIGRDGDGQSWEGFDRYHRAALLQVAASGCTVACFAANTPHHRLAQISDGVPIEVVALSLRSRTRRPSREITSFSYSALGSQ